MKKIFTISNLVYFLFSALYITWVLVTYRNIIHMDMIDIVVTKVSHLFEHNLHPTDFVYEPLFPCSVSIIFTFINAKLFHLNTVIEIGAGAVVLAIAGYIYVSRVSVLLVNNRQKLLFALLTGFLVFGLHKWEASFTSFFSFAVSLNLAICFANYFFLFRYIDEDASGIKSYCMPLMIFSNLLFIFEEEAYFYGYIVVILLFLFLIRRYGLMAINMKRWKTLWVTCLSLLLFALLLTAYLKSNPVIKQGVQKPTMGGFVQVFLEKPFWVIKFYLLAHSGAFLGEAYNHLRLRALAGLLILIAYGAAIGYVIRRRDKRLYVMVALILYNIFSCGLETIGRYTTDDIAFGASSRYTVFNLSGVLGLATIIFFYILEGRSKVYRTIAWTFLGAVLAGYVYVDVRQLEIAPYRTANFRQMRESLLTGENLSILLDRPAMSLAAIDVLKKYHLNVYYGQTGTAGPGGAVLSPDDQEITLVSGTPVFAALQKTGFYDNENGISWTNGKAAITLDVPVGVKDSLVVQLNTYMPPICKNVNPTISWTDAEGKEHTPVHTDRKGDVFYYVFYADQRTDLVKINIMSQTVDAGSDKRVLSFPFVSLEIKR